MSKQGSKKVHLNTLSASVTKLPFISKLFFFFYLKGPLDRSVVISIECSLPVIRRHFNISLEEKLSLVDTVFGSYLFLVMWLI